MAQSKFHVTITTPDGSVYEADATMLVFDTTDGQMGIMANHIPVITALGINAMVVKHADTNKPDDTIAVNGGLLEFDHNQATVVADSAELPENIDVERAQSDKKHAEENIRLAHQHHDKNELGRAEAYLKRSINRLQVSQLVNK